MIVITLVLASSRSWDSFSICTERDRQRERDRQTERETDRQTDRQRETDIHKRQKKLFHHTEIIPGIPVCHTFVCVHGAHMDRFVRSFQMSLHAKCLCLTSRCSAHTHTHTHTHTSIPWRRDERGDERHPGLPNREGPQKAGSLKEGAGAR